MPATRPAMLDPMLPGGNGNGVPMSPSDAMLAPPMAPPIRSMYRKPLPEPAIAFSSPQGEAIFQEALLSGGMHGFFRLIEQFTTQDEPAFCGLASVSMVLNALSIDPRRVWKGPWRWFKEEMLDCCKPVAQVKLEGVTLAQAACVAQCNGAHVDLHMFGTFTLEQFRAAVRKSCASSCCHMIVGYSRKALNQTGDGHFSPVGGFHAERDMALVLDVARFKYPPHWVPVTALYKAMSLLDPETSRPRGFMTLYAPAQPVSVLFTLDMAQHVAWQEAQHFMQTSGPQLVRLALDSATTSTTATTTTGVAETTPATSLPATTTPALDPANPSPHPTSAAALISLLLAIAPLPSLLCLVTLRPGVDATDDGKLEGSCWQQAASCSAPGSGPASLPAARLQVRRELRSLPLHAAVMASPALQTFVAGERQHPAAPNKTAAAAGNGHGLDSVAAPCSNNGAGPASPPMTTLLDAADRVSVLLLAMLLRPATAEDEAEAQQAQQAQQVQPSGQAHAQQAPQQDAPAAPEQQDVALGLYTAAAPISSVPSPRRTFPGDASWTSAASVRSSPGSEATTLLAREWSALLDLSHNSLVEGEVQYMFHALGVLQQYDAESAGSAAQPSTARNCTTVASACCDTSSACGT